LRNSGYTTLIESVRWNRFEIFEILLRSPSISLTAVDKNGANVFEHIEAYGAELFAQKLREIWPGIRLTVKNESIAKIFKLAVFNRVSPDGSVRISGQYLEKPYGLMSTPVTQYQWAMVMGNNPSNFREGLTSVGLSSVELTIRGRRVRMNPNLPVESVSAGPPSPSTDGNNIHTFIRHLNQLSKENDPLIYRVIADHERGRVYRLPTRQEWEYIFSKKGRDQNIFRFNSMTTDKAWYRDNASSPQEVGLRPPIVVDGNSYYDMLGNVWERVVDGSQSVIVGGSWKTRNSAQQSHYDYLSPSVTRDTIGFRLAW
jgi:hypothetical protein